MAKLLRLRRGTDTQHTTFTGAEGEVTVNTTNDSLHVHDGTTAGGRELLRKDLNNLGAGAITSTHIADGTIVNADLNASAAIAHTKLANITAGSVLMGNASAVPTATALSGDVTVNSSGVTAISSGVIVDGDINAAAAIAKTKISGTAITANDTGTVTSTMIADGTIVNADINAAAAIDKTKISGTAITANDTGTVTSTMIADGTIVNGDINASAGIALSKLATGALPSAITVASANIVDGTISSADLADGSVTATKLGATGTIVQMAQTPFRGTYQLSWATNGDSGQLSSNFDVTMTPVSRSNYFLLETCWHISSNTGPNCGFAWLENSTGSRAFVRDTSNNQWVNNGTVYWPSGNGWPNIQFQHGGVHGGESTLVLVTRMLTRLNTTSGSGAVTWSFNWYGGEQPPINWNYQYAPNSASYWSMPFTSTTTVYEIKA